MTCKYAPKCKIYLASDRYCESNGVGCHVYQYKEKLFELRSYAEVEIEHFKQRLEDKVNE